MADMTTNDISSDNSLFTSEHLSVYSCASIFLENQTFMVEKVVELLTPQVVKALPIGWQGIETPKQALNWLNDRFNESNLLAIKLKQSHEIIGFVFIHKTEENVSPASFNIGYLIGEKYWGKGYASEVLTALVNYYKNQAKASILLAGVETDNIASIKVLEKCGFEISKSKMAQECNLFYELRL
ncbi:N-acetyltransferase [Pseudoalteromonas tunicata]|jgi:RimJ/RimL family protein N-acetyltransferase|uniref:Ferrichrome-binding protein n=2 Tax=Pseudoalteromonas tunicata TaxID=314281 RepID=A4CB73_9GAMM|nr:N-acetyltransferase [Pseudoalteromonas tunicata]EAR27610.1 ferrichrome-binding protein [Pseudoalteromonas tunicata D2]